ncbi:MAG TPA: hypothetical protein VIO94_00305, partial [Phenylobacterium sp.]
AREVLSALDARWPNDPTTLYRLTYLDYMLFESAARAGRTELSSQAIAAAQARIGQLLALEAHDRALTTLKVNIGQSYAQDLSNRGRHVDAIAEQRKVLATVAARLTPERRAITLADLGHSHLVLGVIGRKAGDRALACESWGRSRALFDEVIKKQPLTGFHASFQKGLDANLALCAAGAPASAMGALK